MNLEKPHITYQDNYSQNGTRAVMTTIFSHFNRYPKQIEEISSKMKKSQPLKMLCIGIAQGEEPLTYLNQACKISEKNGKPLQEILDLTLVEAANKIPICSQHAKEKGINQRAINHLENLTDERNKDKKVHYSTPFENFNLDNQKYDVILLNNVIQHINYDLSGEEKILNKINELISSLNPNGIFCFTCEPHVLHSRPKIMEEYNKVINILTQKGFEETQEGSGVYKCIK